MNLRGGDRKEQRQYSRGRKKSAEKSYTPADVTRPRPQNATENSADPGDPAEKQRKG